MNQIKNKSVLITTDKASRLKPEPTPVTDIELQSDYDYFRAQEVAKSMLDSRLISLLEFNKLTQLNRETFSPILAEIMPKIT